MCGVVGGISLNNSIVPVILDGLSRLEYRGYDSVGIVLLDPNYNLIRERVVGRVNKIAAICEKAPQFQGKLGIGHTRWATHGGVTLDNAHPHLSNDLIAIVHNGIIENYLTIKNKLITQGYKFESETDTEVVAHLIHANYIKHQNLLLAVRESIAELSGAFAIGVIAKDSPNEIVCARFGSPLVVGLGDRAMYFASDISALLPVTQKVIYLEDGDIARLTATSYDIYDKQNQKTVREIYLSKLSANQTELGKYSHFMQKEIFEQPDVITETIHALGNEFAPQAFGADAEVIFKKIKRIQIVACGTSLNAGHVAKYWLEEFADIETTIEIASEYRYRKVAHGSDTLLINISQSGETADTLAAVKYAHSMGITNTLSICNVPESSLVRLSKLHVLTQAGPEIGVASTKAFTTQLIALLYLALTLAKIRGFLPSKEEKNAMFQIRKLPHAINSIFSLEEDIKLVAKELAYTKNVFFLGRNYLYPVAIESALKLKEISYIHAESYAAGELKHGPLALIDQDMPSVVLMPSKLLFDKMESNVQEILARSGKVYLFTDSKTNISNSCHRAIYLDSLDLPGFLLPFIYTIPLQLLAYHTAIFKGTDVDKPRNLAKSVTVE